MYGNGVAIGKVITAVPLKPILQALIVGRSACTVAVAGTTTRGTAACRTVASATRHPAASSSASASPSEVNFSFQRLLSFTPFIIIFNFKLSTGLVLCPPERR